LAPLSALINALVTFSCTTPLDKKITPKSLPMKGKMNWSL